MTERQLLPEVPATASSSYHPSRQKSRSYNNYTIAWICALPKEMEAARAMLDEVHEPLIRKPNDTNTYVFGRIQNHNVVIACLPLKGYGTNNAATVAAHIRRTFPSLCVSLMVGIGGGVPGKVDIRLGDVVVGTEVVQYDLGKTVENGQIQCTSIPKGLHPLIGTALASLKSDSGHSDRIRSILEDKFDKKTEYHRPDSEDRLFRPEYEHVSKLPSCDKCEKSKLVPRDERGTPDPVIHYGTIVSGNQVMKSGTKRDDIAGPLGAICFEMESAGLMDDGPCLPIRGICDYSDSHKNDGWQEYAAAAAAAYAREFLMVLPASHPNLESVQDPEDKQCLKDLRPTDPSYDKARIQATKGGLLKESYRWILDHDDYRKWRSDPHSQMLWITGDPGKGKTMLLCGIIDELKDHVNCLSYFFCQATDGRLDNATAVLRGLIYHLVVQQPSLVSHVRKEYDNAGKQLFEDVNAWEALSKILEAMLDDPDLNGAILIIDALDECTTNRHQLLNFITRPSAVKWVVSSRNLPDIEAKLDNAEQGVRLHLELNQHSISSAVKKYIEHKVDELAKEKDYDDETRDAVQQHLVSGADDTFLWVALVCRELADEKVVRRKHTKSKLGLFPPGLKDLYKRMLKTIFVSDDAEICKEILAIALVVYRPITLEELKALVESLEEEDYTELPEIIKACGSFLTLREGVIYFVHQSAKDFLLNKAPDQILVSGIAHQHHAIFSKSLATLSETLRRDIYGLSTPGFPIEQVLSPNPDPLSSVGYSCVYWADHLVDSNPKSGDKDLQYDGIVGEFIQKKYLYWLESLSLLRRLSDGVQTVHKLEALVRNNGSQQLADLLRDARQFILSHGQPIEIAPLQTYASALVFSPERSLVRGLFKKEEPNWMRSKPVMEPDWNACLQTLEGHSNTVSSVAISADGQRLASGSDDKTIRIWNLATGLCMQTLKGHSHWVKSVAISADGQRFASGSVDRTIKVWDIARTASVAISADGQRFASGLIDRTIKVWDIARTASVAISADGQRLASGSNDETIRIWNLATGKCVQTLKGHSNWVTSVAISADSQRLASGSNDETIRIWNLATGKCVQTLKGHSSWVKSVAISADGQRFASGSVDRTIKVWDIARTASVAISADGQRLASGSKGKTVKLWNIMMSAVAISANGKRLASVSDDTIRVWDAVTGECVQTFKGHSKMVTSVAISADGQRLASVLRKARRAWNRITNPQILTMVRVWDIATDKCVLTHEHDDDWIGSVALLEDGRRLALISFGKVNIAVWDIATDKRVQTIMCPLDLRLSHWATPKYLTLSEDVQRLAAVFQNIYHSGIMDWDINVFDTATGACVHTLRVGCEITYVSFDPTSASRLLTNIGLLSIDLPAPPPDDESQSIEMDSQMVSHCGYGISTDGKWVVKDETRMLWLPTEYRAMAPSVVGSTVAIGTTSHRVVGMKFS